MDSDEDCTSDSSSSTGSEPQDFIIREHVLLDQEDHASDYTSSSGASSESSESTSNASGDEECSIDDSNGDQDRSNILEQKTVSTEPFNLPKTLSGESQLVQEKPIPQSSDLFSRLTEFLPSMRAANMQLEERISQGQATQSILEVGEEDEDGEPHVDMDVSLGVLEQSKDALDDDSSDSDIDCGEEDLGGNTMLPTSPSAMSRKRRADVLDVLMNRKKRRKPEIEDLGGPDEN